MYKTTYQTTVNIKKIQQSHAHDPLQIQSLERFVQALTCTIFDCPCEALFTRYRGSEQVSLCRQVIFYLLHVECGFTLTAIAKRYGRDRTTASYACRKVEDRRENIVFDNLLNAMEGILRAIKCII